MVTMEVLISRFSEDFEEAMLRLKESGSFEGPFSDTGESTDPSKNFISVQRTVHSDFSRNQCCSCKPRLRFTWVT